jgi:hypothetical protein
MAPVVSTAAAAAAQTMPAAAAAAPTSFADVPMHDGAAPGYPPAPGNFGPGNFGPGNFGPPDVFRPRPPCPIASFGFGGRLALMFPERKRTLTMRPRGGSQGGADEDPYTRPGVIRLRKVHTSECGIYLQMELQKKK